MAGRGEGPDVSVRIDANDIEEEVEQDTHKTMEEDSETIEVNNSKEDFIYDFGGVSHTYLSRSYLCL